MSKAKLRWIMIATLLLALAFTLGLALTAIAPRKADALSYSPSSIFAAGTGGEVGTSSAAEGKASYVQFSMHDDGKIYFRRDLALKWFSAVPSDETTGDETTGETGDGNDETGGAAAQAETEEGGLVKPGEAHYFSMSFGFPAVHFEEFRISFESAEENISKDGIATNAVVFAYRDAHLYASVHDASFDEDDENAAAAEHDLGMLGAIASETFTLSIAETYDAEGTLTECSIGEFAVSLQLGEGEAVYLGNFTNIGGYYLEYRSSAASTPSTPITFGVTLLKEEGTEDQLVEMYSLNGQTFEIGDDNRVTDNAAPVLVLNESVYSFRLGQRFSLNYEAMDVCDDSVSVSRSYYMLARDSEGNYKKPNEETEDDYRSLFTSTFFLPPDDANDEEVAYVSIRFSLDDGRGSEKDYVFLTWYVDEDVRERTVFTLGEGENAFDYILVDREAEGPSYIGVTVPTQAEVDAKEAEAKNTATEDATARANAFQAELDKAAEGVSAGDGAYLYLPSLRGLIGSDYADYRNLRFSVYYFKPDQTAGASATSATSLRYNNLRFEVDEVGYYRFRVLAEDAAGNAMEMYDKDGELVKVTSSNIWDIEGIPEFSVYIDYDGPSIDDAGSQSLGYRGSTYSVSSFEVVALEGYDTSYTLYYFNEDKLAGHAVPTYSQLVDAVAKDSLDPTTHQPDKWIADCLEEIDVFNSEIDEEDEEWSRTDNDYAWDPDSSLSFCPQQRGFYFVKVTVTDAYLVNTTTTAYQVIEVRNSIDHTSGQSPWLRNNTMAIVFFSISAALLVAIIVLFVIKPSDKTVEEVDLDTLKGKKSDKKDKKDKE